MSAQVIHHHYVIFNYVQLNLFNSWAPIPQNAQTHSNTSRQQPTKCLSVFDHLVGLALKGLRPMFPSNKNKPNNEKIGLCEI